MRSYLTLRTGNTCILPPRGIIHTALSRKPVNCKKISSVFLPVKSKDLNIIFVQGKKKPCTQRRTTYDQKVDMQVNIINTSTHQKAKHHCKRPHFSWFFTTNDQSIHNQLSVNKCCHPHHNSKARTSI